MRKAGTTFLCGNPSLRKDTPIERASIAPQCWEQNEDNDCSGFEVKGGKK